MSDSEHECTPARECARAEEQRNAMRAYVCVCVSARSLSLNPNFASASGSLSAYDSAGWKACLASESRSHEKSTMNWQNGKEGKNQESDK
jgi:hypothetical protein